MSHPAILVLTTNQVRRLLSLIDAPKPGYEKRSGKISWMLDNGASYHRVGDESMLSDIKQISLVDIGLPNGAYTIASERGLVSLGEDIKWKNVLYVLNLKCNLVSISKLCKELNGVVTYFDSFCMIQDCILRTLTRADE